MVDANCRIKYISTGGVQSESELKLIIANRFKLQPNVETFVRGLTAIDHAKAAPSVRLEFLDDYRVLRVVRVVGDDGTMFILNVEEDRNCTSLVRAARRHQLTRRETEVLALILDGSSAGEIATALAISEHTVQGYFKRLLFKTGARNRVSMVAGIFDWNPRVRDDRAIPAALRGNEPLEDDMLIDATA
ncbi:MAG TPA: helix-turn-helix transcriptional regulator [Candidatus Acidoferrales bacterium]|nr:helix-turn-helix transcriptional regulator [Candidatus Acidoferrales bacterium]